MATYKGKSGIELLRQKILEKSKSLVAESSKQIALELIDQSVVGAEIYPTASGDEVYNDQGDYKNSWNVVLNANEAIHRQADEEAGEAVSQAYNFKQQYNLDDAVFVINAAEHAGQVEYGWDANLEFGWKPKAGYHTRDDAIPTAQQILVQIATKLAE